LIFCLDWVRAYSDDFLKRFTFLLGYDFKTFEVPLCLSVINPNLTSKETDEDGDDKEIANKVL
jgi:tRNA(Met) C34 N-acetyltransferase TmcA